ncbi:transglutaminase-like cysteine peptidase [Jiella marina]|uniref:transglutaminase-like cysteine peptidase n=1 Tax=Jiella sp. LLJ827 TaxID=2917712 RepID=UPI002101B131|nr:transglutaminase-like cysteine peptidase [Jiella sp. LLJ827]MCQ0988380.1 transglutaminase-like cysteine peptidase [Jiella sp. LLJ827]
MVEFRAIGATLLLCLLVGGLAVKPASAQMRGSFMKIGVSAPKPIGHAEFCTHYADECRTTEQRSNPAPLQLTPDIIQTVAAINVAINAKIKPRSDQDIYGVEERWTYPGEEGDCEDFVLLKRKTLHERARIDLANLLITVVRKTDGEGHAVLTLRTTDGDFILDNLNWRILPWDEAPYAFLKRQSSLDPGKWNRIANGREVLVGAVSE